MQRMPQNSNKVMDWMTLSGYRLPPGTHAGAVAAAVAANAANASAAAAAAASTAAAASACDAIGVDPLQHSMEASSSMTSSSAAAIGNHAASVTPPKSEYKVNVSELGQAISPDETKGEQKYST